LPDQNLLVLIPQQHSSWTLKRIAAWSTDNPKEETLFFTGNPLTEGESGLEDLSVNPAGHYAVIRIRSFGGNLYDGTVRNRTALIILVDLQGFQVVNQRTTTDPLFAASEWSFTENGLLITINSACSAKTSLGLHIDHGCVPSGCVDFAQLDTVNDVPLRTSHLSSRCHFPINLARRQRKR
jgi:hypothetical protein